MLECFQPQHQIPWEIEEATGRELIRNVSMVTLGVLLISLFLLGSVEATLAVIGAVLLTLASWTRQLLLQKLNPEISAPPPPPPPPLHLLPPA